MRPPEWAPAHTKLATSCLTYLTFDDFSSGRAKSDYDFEDRTDLHQLLRYASTHWGPHAQRCQQQLLRDFHGVLRKFLQKHSFTFAASQARNARGYWSGYSQEPAHWLWSRNPASFGLAETFSSVLRVDTEMFFRVINIDFEDESCIMTPLALACSAGHADVVRLLLDLELGEVRLDSGVAFRYPTPLGHAVNNGHHAVVRLFIGLGPGLVDLNSNIHCRRRPPLAVAAKNGSFDTVNLLVRVG